jgi:hypothetical protein
MTVHTRVAIRWYEHNHFWGWVFATKRRGRRWVKDFSDKPHGRLDALRRARMYRDALLRKLPPAMNVKWTYVSNTTGEIGVALIKDRTRSGRVIWRHVAQWPTPEGGARRPPFRLDSTARPEPASSRSMRGEVDWPLLWERQEKGASRRASKVSALAPRSFAMIASRRFSQDIERESPLLVVAVRIVDRDDARLDVVHDLRGDRPRDAGADHEAGRGCAASVRNTGSYAGNDAA